MEPQVGAHLTLNFGARKFYDIRIPCYSELANLNSEGDASSIKLFSYVEENCIGKDLQFNSPFGELPVTYCDFTASGKALRFIEDFIQDEVLPHYGNTHTTTSVTSLQTTLFRHEARDIIRSAVNANEADVVIFVSSGVTGAIHKLIHALNMQKPPVVFVSPYEHHSNLLSWKEIGGEIVWNREDENGGIDIVDLENNLKKYQGCGRPLIGCFSAASNVTGILTAVDRVAACLHAYGALAFFDYATAAPYVEVNMNPLPINEKYGECHKDAVFISTHKFVGGPGTPAQFYDHHITYLHMFLSRVHHNFVLLRVFVARRPKIWLLVAKVIERSVHSGFSQRKSRIESNGPELYVAQGRTS